MKRISKVSGLIAFVAITALASATLVVVIDGGMTTADSVLRLTHTSRISLTVEDSPKSALEFPCDMEIDLGSDLEVAMIEQVPEPRGLVVDVSVPACRPQEAVTPAVSSAIIRSFTRDLQGAGAVSGQRGVAVIHAARPGRALRPDSPGIPPTRPTSMQTPVPARSRLHERRKEVIA